MKRGWLVLAGLAAMCIAPQANAILIDDFSVPAVLPSANAANPIQHSFQVGAVLGGEREITAIYGGGPTNVDVEVLALQGLLTHSQGGGTTGASVFVYDGSIDAGAAGANGFGLGGLDLTAGGGTKFTFDVVFSDHAVTNVLGIRVFSDVSNYSDLSITLPAINSLTSVDFLFSDFILGDGALGTADFGNVGSIVFFINGVSEPALDVVIDSFYTDGEDDEPVIPEPATLALLGLGLTTMGAIRRRSRKA